MTKRIFFAILIMVLSISGAMAETVFISLLEQSSDGEFHNFESSSAWEAGVLDALFDLGAIVSNTPIQTKDAFVLDEALRSAKEGGASSVLVVELDYKVIPTKDIKNRPAPVTIHFTLYETDSGTIKNELKYIQQDPSLNAEEDKQRAVEQTRRLFLNK